jgi:hypothetical protein
MTNYLNELSYDVLSFDDLSFDDHGINNAYGRTMSANFIMGFKPTNSAQIVCNSSNGMMKGGV